MKKTLLLILLVPFLSFIQAQEPDPVQARMNELRYEYNKQRAMDSVAHAKETEIMRAEIEMLSVHVRATRSQFRMVLGLSGLLLLGNIFLFWKWKKSNKS